MFQQVIIIGNLGKDPESRSTPSGDLVCSFSVATSKRWTGNDGQRQEKTIWWRCTAWRKQAELCSQYLHKGARVQIVGTMEEPNAYKDRDGNARASLEMMVGQITFLTSRAEAEQQAAVDGALAGAADEDSIPF